MLRNLAPILDSGILRATNYTVQMLRLQVWWHREWVDIGSKGEKMMPLMNTIGTKDKMLAALIEAVERYNASPELQKRAKDQMAKYDRNMRAGRIWEEDEDEGEDED
ncbi:hypothetical protein LXA43DRAFT_1066264 [Ganoderma leucocontextum]|nr:hypothetical protein LXA43DRAFT_1066264 [Ganoderma leucocontextum]